MKMLMVKQKLCLEIIIQPKPRLPVGTGPREAPAVNLNPEAINESVNTQNQENTIIDSIFGGR